MNKLNFLTPGLPMASEGKGYNEGLKIIKEMDLDGMEVEFVHGVKMNEQTQKFVKEFTQANNLTVTCHGPFYINLNLKRQELVRISEHTVLPSMLLFI